jgi:hypothetical protein
MTLQTLSKASGVSDLLDMSTYDAAENAAVDRLSNRIVQAFYPDVFATVGYPVRVKRADQLWRYIDVMHETQADHLIDEVLEGMTADEFELYKRITQIVDHHATTHFGMRAHATAALLRAIHALRLIKIATGEARPAVLEVGPGCGYLAMLLVLEGYPYIGTDVAQAFYLYQSHMLSHVATFLHELAVGDADILTVEQPKPGTAIHIPWWKWFTLTPEKIKLAAGIMTSNHVLCEMHPSSAAYMAVVGHRMLSNPPGAGKFVFDNWGSPLLRSPSSVVAKFAEHGLRLCHDEHAMSAMVLQEELDLWLGTTTKLHQKSPNAHPVQPRKSRRSILRRGVGRALDVAPPLKRLAIAAYQAAMTPPTAPVVQARGTVHPLSRQLTAGRSAVIAQATIHKAELRAFLTSYFGGAAPQSPDDVFFALAHLP